PPLVAGRSIGGRAREAPQDPPRIRALHLARGSLSTRSSDRGGPGPGATGSDSLPPPRLLRADPPGSAGALAARGFPRSRRDTPPEWAARSERGREAAGHAQRCRGDGRDRPLRGDETRGRVESLWLLRPGRDDRDALLVGEEARR